MSKDPAPAPLLAYAEATYPAGPLPLRAFQLLLLREVLGGLCVVTTALFVLFGDSWRLPQLATTAGVVILAVWSDQFLRRHRTYLHQSLDFIALMGLLVLLFAHLPALYFGRGALLMIGGVGLIPLAFSSPRHVYRCRLLADACGGTGTSLGKKLESLGVYRALVESSGLVSVSLAPWVTPAPPFEGPVPCGGRHRGGALPPALAPQCSANRAPPETSQLAICHENLTNSGFKH